MGSAFRREVQVGRSPSVVLLPTVSVNALQQHKSSQPHPQDTPRPSLGKCTNSCVCMHQYTELGLICVCVQQILIDVGHNLSSLVEEAKRIINRRVENISGSVGRGTRRGPCLHS